MFTQLFDSPIKIKVLNTLLIVASSTLLKFIAQKALKKSPIQSAALKQRWLIQIRNLTILLILLGVITIWGEQLRTLILSFFAVMAAFVLATKELILCLTGSLLKAGTSSFTVGDLIVVGGFRGVVADQTLLSTTLYEVGPSNSSHQLTGKTTTIPNSLFLTQGIINENTANTYKLHSFSIKCKKMEYFEQIEECLLKEMNSIIDAYLQEALHYLQKKLPSSDITLTTCSPKLILSDYDGESGNLLLRLPVISSKTGSIEQALIRKYSSFINNLKITVETKEIESA